MLPSASEGAVEGALDPDFEPPEWKPRLDGCRDKERDLDPARELVPSITDSTSESSGSVNTDVGNTFDRRREHSSGRQALKLKEIRYESVWDRKKNTHRGSTISSQKAWAQSRSIFWVPLAAPAEKSSNEAVSCHIDSLSM